jgi:hypothetical protein
MTVNHLGYMPTSPRKYFIERDGTKLKGFAALKCYYGHWYLCTCVVKPE